MTPRLSFPRRHGPTRPGSARNTARLLLAAAALLWLMSPAFGQFSKRAWTQAAVSGGLHSLNHAAHASYQPASALPPGSLITHVYADRDYIGQADIQTSLCWNGRQHCVDIIGRSINTRAFNGLDASQPLQLVHRARSWHGSHKPVYVKGNVTVWYDTPADRVPSADRDSQASPP